MSPIQAANPGLPRLRSKRSVDIMIARQQIRDSQAETAPPITPAMLDRRLLGSGTPDDNTPIKSSLRTNKSSFEKVGLRSGNVPLLTSPHRERFAPATKGASQKLSYGTTSTPSPNTHPLLRKPIPREENFNGVVHSSKDSAKSSRTASDSSTDLPRDIRSSPYPGLERPVYTPVPGRISRHTASPSVHMLNMSNLRQRETAALHAASDAKYVQDWGFYMKCYAEGRFNVSNPPEPPPRCFSFSYLTAPTPQDEVRRLEAVKRVDVFYPSSTIETAEHLILLARKIFQVNGSALSFLERDSEIMRVECGYGQRLISRQDSIAAHVLLAGGEPMVILDAQKDWRVNGNPLVQGPPYIRFFAVAPLVTLEGYIIGAFAVFDTEPREHFSVRSRRSLVDFTKIAMTDIEEVSAEHPALRQQVFTPEPSKGTGEHVNYPRAGSKRRSITRLLNDFEQEARGKDEDEMRWVSSRPDYSDTKEVEKHSPSTTKTSIFEGNSFSTFAEVYAAESQHGRNASGGTEEASRSTVNAMQKRKGRLSVPTPPDTPLNGINPHSPETVFRARSDSPTLPFHGPPKSIRHNVREDANVFTDEAPALGTSGLLGSSVLGRNGDSEELKPARNLEEAEKILDAVADELKFDFVYLLALQPYPPAHYGDIPRDHDETHACHLFAAHGLPDPMPEFAPGLHLNALQQAGGMVYINGVEPSSQDDDVAFCMGVLVPVVRYQTLGRSPPQPNLEEDLNCQGGALLAAYKKHNPKEIDSEDIFDAMRYAARLLKTFAQDPFET